MVEPGARVERSSVRGPAIIGAGARHRARLRRPVHGDLGRASWSRDAEIEHSIVLEDSRVEDLDARVESSLIGAQRHASSAAPAKPRAYRFMVGDSSAIGLV